MIEPPATPLSLIGDKGVASLTLADERLTTIAIACSPSITPPLAEHWSHHMDAHHALGRFCCRTLAVTMISAAEIAERPDERVGRHT